MNIMNIFAHAGEVHESATEAAAHQISAPKWYVVIPITALVFGTLLFVVLQMLANISQDDKQDK